MLDNRDLNQILSLTSKDLNILKNSNIFLTGGTGYIGRWILETISFANTHQNLNINVCVLSRNINKFKSVCPHLGNNPNIDLIEGDVRNFKYPTGSFDYAIHAATDVININDPLETFDVTVNGTKYLLDFCESASIKDVLLLSSGAVYGVIPQSIDLVDEDYPGSPSTSRLLSAYGIGKIATEWLGTAYSQLRNVRCKSARIFAQVGPYLELNKQFAAGNFLLNALENRTFIINGNGTALRSYMYGVDLVTWLFAILVRGNYQKTYNVGSDRGISITDLAYLTAGIAKIDSPIIEIRGRPDPTGSHERYVPNVSRATKELDLKINVSIEDAFLRTYSWYLKQKKWVYQ
jgi:nucleoside-diphosphate-sugar epimerase